MGGWRKFWVILAAGAALLAVPGCKKRTPVAVPPAAAPAPQPAESTVPPPTPASGASVEPPPLPAQPPTQTAPALPEATPPLPSQPEIKRTLPPPAAKPPANPAPPTAVPEKSSEPHPEPPQQPPRFTLGQLLSPEQQADYQRRIAAALLTARQNLRAARPRLTSSHRETYRRVEAFILQAEQLRRQDPVQALSLSERAALLAADLLRSLP